MPLNKRQIHERALQGMIEHYEAAQVKENLSERLISYGLGRFGYDMRIGDVFKVPNLWYAGAIDPKKFDPNAWLTITVKGAFVLPPNSFCLAESIEVFHIPRDLIGIVLGKSTYARSGVVANFTPLEPGWKGTVTIELGNLSPLPVLIYPNEGIAQVIFLQGEETEGYSGKYQNQYGIVHGRA
jgi:dCTP deaminase